MQKEASVKHFFFKGFKLQDANTSMKIGTDAMLLGAWASKYSYTKILDIGSGCGIIAFMLLYARESSNATMVEIDSSAVIDIRANMEQEIFANRCNIINQDIKEFPIKEKFDIIVSNPPYFAFSEIQSPEKKRTISRQENADGLTLKDLVSKSCKLMETDGRLCIIIPFDRLADIRKYLAFNCLMLDEIVEIYTNKNDMPKRVILSIRHINQFNYTKTLISKMYINDTNGGKHKDYIDLISPFI